jgi:hypothetical protein
MTEQQPATPPAVVAVLLHLLKARGIDMTRRRNIARMAHALDREAALWLGSADAEMYRAALREARERARERG